MVTTVVVVRSRLPGDRWVAARLGRPETDRLRPALSCAVEILSPVHLVLAAVVVVAVISFRRRSLRVAGQAALSTVPVVVLLGAMKALVWRSGPQGRSAHRLGGSFPSAHLAVALLCLDTVLWVLGVQTVRRVAAALLLALLFGWVLIRLRDHWLGDLVGSVLLVGMNRASWPLQDRVRGLEVQSAGVDKDRHRGPQVFGDGGGRNAEGRSELGHERTQ